MSHVTPRDVAARRKQRIFFALMLSLPILTLGGLYVGSILARGGWSYYKFKIRQHSWSGQAWQADPALGYTHMPGFRGRQYLRPAVSQAIRIDEAGFRIPEAGRVEGREGPRLLSLGGSFTFGVGVECEQTYTDLVAERLDGRPYNGGVNGYGLSQMLIQSRQLLGPVAPDIVLVGYASWLVDRASQSYSSTRFAAVPVPYVVGPGPPVDVEPPVFAPKVFDLDIPEHLTRPVGLLGLTSYLVHVALPLYLHDDPRRLAHRVELRTGLRSRPLSDGASLVRAIYGEILANTRAAGARLYVVDISSFSSVVEEEIVALRSIPGLRFVETRGALWRHVDGETADDFLKVFGHWAGDPPVMVDLHPNARSHRILAEETWKAIEADLGASPVR